MSEPKAPTRVINFRAPLASHALIDHAATVAGMSRTEFILDASCSRAREVLADQTRFALDEDTLRRFNEAIDQATPNVDGLRRLLAKLAPWEK